MTSDKKRIVKFIGKCALCLIPLAGLILYTLLCPFCYLDEEYPAWKYTMDVSAGKAGEEYYDTVILGDSVAMSSVIPSEISDFGTVNLAVGGATSVEMYFFMKQYLQNHEAPKKVAVLFGPFHYWKIDNYKTRTVYFKALSAGDSAELYKVAKSLDSPSVCFEDYMMYELSCRCALPTVYMPAITAEGFNARRKPNLDSYERIATQNGYGAFGTEELIDAPSYEASYESLDFDSDSALLMYYMKELINLCKSHDCEVILLQPAESEVTFNAFHEKYLEDYYKLLEEIAAENPDIYVERKLRCYENDCFGDVSHLNEKGAKRYSSEVSEIVKVF